MNRDTEKKFYSKVLLFGEYSVIQNSMALSIPYSLFEGRLTFRRDNTAVVDPELKAFSLYLKQLIEAEQLLFNFDITSFEFGISQGLFFDSTIPQGYGVGSSGALVAAIFDRYEQEVHSSLDISKLKKIFSQMESHFHGASSGVDPLISYLNSPILIKSKNELGPVMLPKFAKGAGGIFLLNTKRSRKTEPLVPRQDPAVPHPGDRRLRRRFTGKQSRQQQVGCGSHRIRPARRQAQDRRSADAGEPQHRSRV